MSERNYRNVAWVAGAIAIVSLIAAGAIFGTKGIFTSKGFLGSGRSVEINEERTYAARGVSFLRAFSTTADVRFMESGGEEIRFHLHGTARTSKEKYHPRLVEQSTGNRLVVGSELPKRLSRLISSDLVLDVHLPADYSGDLRIDSVSGDVELSFGEYQDLSMKTTSGEIDVDAVTTESIAVETTSGDITAARIEAGSVNAESTSGEIEFDGAVVEVDAGTTSGDISFAIEDLLGDVTIGSTSGDVKLALPKEKAFDLSVRSTSGDIECDFPVTVQGSRGGPGNKVLEGIVGDGGPDVTIKTVSGDVEIRS